MIMTFNPFNWAWVDSETLQAVIPMRASWVRFVFFSQLVDGAMIIIWERIVVEYFSRKRKEELSTKALLAKADEDVYMLKRRFSDFLFDSSYKKDPIEDEDEEKRKSA